MPTSVVHGSENSHPAPAGGTEARPSGGGGGGAVAVAVAAAAEAAATDGNGEADGGRASPEEVVPVAEADEGVKIEELLEGQRLLRLELEEAGRRMEKARRGRKAAEKVRQGRGWGGGGGVGRRGIKKLFHVAVFSVRWEFRIAMYIAPFCKVGQSLNIRGSQCEGVARCCVDC